MTQVESTKTNVPSLEDPMDAALSSLEKGQDTSTINKPLLIATMLLYTLTLQATRKLIQF